MKIIHFIKKKIPTSRESLIADNRKMALYWERLTTRNQDLSLERLKSESIAQLKSHYKWNISREAATIWLDWKNKTHLSKKSSSKKRSSKKRSSKRYVNNRHYKTSPSKERGRSERPSPSTGASSQKMGVVMTGNDGNMYKVIRTVSGIRRWSKI